MVVNHGKNGATSASNVSSWLTSARTTFGALCLVVYSCSPGAAKTTLQTGVSNYLAGAPADTKVALIDLSGIEFLQQG